MQPLGGRSGESAWAWFTFSKNLCESFGLPQQPGGALSGSGKLRRCRAALSAIPDNLGEGSGTRASKCGAKLGKLRCSASQNRAAQEGGQDGGPCQRDPCEIRKPNSDIRPVCGSRPREKISAKSDVEAIFGTLRMHPKHDWGACGLIRLHRLGCCSKKSIPEDKNVE